MSISNRHFTIVGSYIFLKRRTSTIYYPTVFHFQILCSNIICKNSVFSFSPSILRQSQQAPQVDEIWRTLQDLDVVDQVACGARIDAAAELGDLEKALELVNFMKKKRAMARWQMFLGDSWIIHCFFSPACQVRFVRFLEMMPASSSSFLPSVLPRRTSFASSWLQWASPDLLCQLLIAVGLAGPPLPALDRSGPRRTSTGESLEHCGPRRASTGESRSAVGLAGPQPARFGALWTSLDLNRTWTARNKAI